MDVTERPWVGVYSGFQIHEGKLKYLIASVFT